jgi:hypothetical protein
MKTQALKAKLTTFSVRLKLKRQGRDVNEQTEVMMAQGGFMKSGTDLTKAPKNPVFDVRYYKNAEGSVMYITHINGKPMTPIPEGYKAVTQEEAQKVGQKAEEAAKAVQTTNESGGYDAPPLDPSVAAFLDEEARQQAEFDAQDRSKEGPREQRMGKVSNVLETIAKWTTPYGTVRNVMDFLKGPQRTDEEAKQIPIEQRTGVAEQACRALEQLQLAINEQLNKLSEDAEYAKAAEQLLRCLIAEWTEMQTVARTAVEDKQKLSTPSSRSYQALVSRSVSSSSHTPESTHGYTQLILDLEGIDGGNFGLWPKAV